MMAMRGTGGLGACAAIMLAVVACTAASPAPQPTAEQVLKEAEAAYRNARTLQMTVQVTTSGGPVGPMISRTDIKTEGGKKTWARLSVMPRAAQPQAGPMLEALSNLQIVDDGKATYYYSPVMHEYMKRPTGVAARLLSVDQMLDRALQRSAVRLVGEQTVAGRPVYVVEASPRGQGQALQGGKMLLYIDRQTHLVDEVKISGVAPAMQGRPARDEAVTILMTNVKVNQPIPASLFKFTPPPDAHPMRGGRSVPVPGSSFTPRAGSRR